MVADPQGGGTKDESRMVRLFDTMLKRLTLRGWQAAAEAAPQASLEDLRQMRGAARALRRPLDRVIQEADHRLALPLIGPNPIRKPPGTDWAWRPDLWRGKIPVPGHAGLADDSPICDGTALFHDCPLSELTIRQIRNSRADDIAPFGLRIEVFRFSGSFLSLSLDLPDEAARALRLRHLVQIDVKVEFETPTRIFARLNLRHGPNLEQMLREMPPGQDHASAEFDLAYASIDENRIEKVWVDLILESPQMNAVILRDVTMTRRPRADL